MNKKSLALAAAVATGWLSPLPSMGQTQPSPQAPPPQALLIQAADGTTYKDGVLTLKDASPATIFFTDRPKRTSGQVSNDTFVKLWSDGENSFRRDPPNAALATFDATGRPSRAIVVLSHPRIEGKDIVYDARTLAGNIPAQSAASTLFIDGGAAPCGLDVNYSGYPCWAQAALVPPNW